jgi:hypothetical protein
MVGIMTSERIREIRKGTNYLYAVGDLVWSREYGDGVVTKSTPINFEVSFKSGPVVVYMNNGYRLEEHMSSTDMKLVVHAHAWFEKPIFVEKDTPLGVLIKAYAVYLGVGENDAREHLVRAKILPPWMTNDYKIPNAKHEEKPWVEQKEEEFIKKFQEDLEKVREHFLTAPITGQVQKALEDLRKTPIQLYRECSPEFFYIGCDPIGDSRSKAGIARTPFPELMKEFAEYYKKAPLTKETKKPSFVNIITASEARSDAMAVPISRMVSPILAKVERAKNLGRTSMQLRNGTFAGVRGEEAKEYLRGLGYKFVYPEKKGSRVLIQW